MGLNKLIIVMSLILSNSTFVNAQDVRAMKPKLIIIPIKNPLILWRLFHGITN